MPVLAHRSAFGAVRPEIERVWSAIDQQDNWEPFNQLVQTLQRLE
ncbi:MAG: YdiU family protein [Synechococcales cyanobacterium RU_4_20]|nr:YdiU family protein [Synechococcales cyanobacterium RU_4_20]